MATVDSLTFSITRTSFPDGHICSVDYSYFLHIDSAKYHAEASFSITVELYGNDLMHDKLLTLNPLDPHVVDRRTAQPVERRFVLPCETLDEAWGEDRIYLKLSIQASDGEHITETSATVRDWF